MRYLVALSLLTVGLFGQDATSVNAPTRLASDPGTCTTGQWYFNTAIPVFRGCTVTNAWTNLGSATPGGSSGQLQTNSGGVFGGITLGGDCTFTSPNVVCTKTNGVAFGAMATLTATAASDLSGTWPNITVAKINGATPVSTNTASTVVLRDGSGNFAAGTITASLTGTATGFSGQVAAANLTVLTTTQDILYRNGASLARLPIISNGTCLGANAGVWTSLACSGGSGGGGGVNTQTVNYTDVTGDSGKMVTMNGSSLTNSLPAAAPSGTWFLGQLFNLNATNLTLSRNGLLINGTASNITLPAFQSLPVYTDGTNYLVPPPLTAGFATTLTPSATSIAIGVNTAVVPSIATAQAGKLTYCNSSTGNSSAICSLSASAVLTGPYVKGTIIPFVTDTAMTTLGSLNVDTIGGASIKQYDGTTDPNGHIGAGGVSFLYYDGSLFRIIQDFANGHPYLGGNPPAMGTCGTSPSLASGATDNAGTINVGSGTVTACTLTFGATFDHAPACVLSDDSTTVNSDVSAVSTTAVTFSFSASLGSGHIYYHCF